MTRADLTETEIHDHNSSFLVCIYEFLLLLPRKGIFGSSTKANLVVFLRCRGNSYWLHLLQFVRTFLWFWWEQKLLLSLLGLDLGVQQINGYRIRLPISAKPSSTGSFFMTMMDDTDGRVFLWLGFLGTIHDGWTPKLVFPFLHLIFLWAFGKIPFTPGESAHDSLHSSCYLG